MPRDSAETSIRRRLEAFLSSLRDPAQPGAKKPIKGNLNLTGLRHGFGA